MNFPIVCDSFFFFKFCLLQEYSRLNFVLDFIHVREERRDRKGEGRLGGRKKGRGRGERREEKIRKRFDNKTEGRVSYVL